MNLSDSDWANLVEQVRRVEASAANAKAKLSSGKPSDQQLGRTAANNTATRAAALKAWVASKTPVIPPPPPPPNQNALNLSADFTNVLQVIDPKNIGAVSSGYGAKPTESATQAMWERNLDSRLWRIPVRLSNDGTTVINSAAGGSGYDVKPVIDLYRSWGHSVLAVCAGRGGDDWGSYQPGDYRKIRSILGTDQIEFTGPNEANLRGQSVEAWATRARQMAAESGAKIGGPVWTHWDLGTLERAIQVLGPENLDDLDWHEYGMGETYRDPVSALRATPDWGNHIRAARGLLGRYGLSSPEHWATLDELNYSWRYDIPGHGPVQEFFTSINTIWMASALAHILAAGGRGLPYATQNGPLGILAQAGQVNPDNRPASTPFPAFWGIAALTGAHLFSHFKDRAYVTSGSTQDVEIFAFNNEAGGRNILLINKSLDKTAEINLTTFGFSGAWDAWDTNRVEPYAAPTKVGPISLTAGSPYPMSVGACEYRVLVSRAA